jgi:endonuclease I
MKKTTLTFILLFSILLGWAQPPAGYYDAAAGLHKTALQQALHDIIDNHNSVTYDYLWTAFQTTDKKPNGKVWDMYSDVPGGTPPYEYTFVSDQCGNYSGEGSCYNREHSWPKSWFSDLTPMYTDMFHLYPTDGYVNGKRSNYPYGKVGSASWTSQNGSKLGSCATPGYTGTVFEPIDAYKGDFARSYFYMATRYFNEDNGWAGSDMTTGSQLKPWAMTMLLLWNDQDPVSLKEINRNNAIFGIQNNRNPFIDHPEYAQNIWGTNAGMAEYTAIVLKATPNPTHDIATIDIPAGGGKHNPVFLVYTLSGSRVDAEVNFISGTARINLGKQPSGVYFVSIKTEGNPVMYHCRIVKN